MGSGLAGICRGRRCGKAAMFVTGLTGLLRFGLCGLFGFCRRGFRNDLIGRRFVRIGLVEQLLVTQSSINGFCRHGYFTLSRIVRSRMPDVAQACGIVLPFIVQAND